LILGCTVSKCDSHWRTMNELLAPHHTSTVSRTYEFLALLALVHVALVLQVFLDVELRGPVMNVLSDKWGFQFNLADADIIEKRAYWRVLTTDLKTK